jgi:hypothetical protein
MSKNIFKIFKNILLIFYLGVFCFFQIPIVGPLARIPNIN